jgi:hypothetical protein
LTRADNLARALLVVTVALAPAGIALTALAEAGGLERPPGEPAGWPLSFLAAGAALLYAPVGFAIARREPANPIGWLFLGTAPIFALFSITSGYVELALYGGHGLPLGVWVGWTGWTFVIPVFLTPTLVVQLFPDGRPVSPRWRIGLWLAVVAATAEALRAAFEPGPMEPSSIENPAGVEGFPSGLAGLPLGPVAVGVVLASVAVRFRRSHGVERQQLKWLAYAGAVMLGSLFLANAVEPHRLSGALYALGFLALAFLPVAVAVAILRYRLYEIDRVISRTLVYGSVTVVLGAAYVGLVLAGQALFSSVAGGGDLAIAVSTLVVAALFLPLRSRVQRLVDRRFYRRRYDAARTLDSFGSRLREQVELDGLRNDLDAAVRETMQPAHVSLWLRREERA